MRLEEKIHFALCDYIRLQYPSVFFISESSGIRTSMGVARKLKRTRSNHTHLDLYVLEPKGKHNALILELKAKSIFKKDGSLLKNEHFEEQQDTINKLNKKGYYCAFACGLTEGIKIIDNYLNGNH